MSSADKRKKRAKAKAKQGKIQKQSAARKPLTEVISISDDMIRLFETLPPATLESPNYQIIPLLKEYVESKDSSSTADVESAVAMAYNTYILWMEFGGNKVPYDLLVTGTCLTLDNPAFSASFYGE